jgi:hypothetical protein
MLSNKDFLGGDTCVSDGGVRMDKDFLEDSFVDGETDLRESEVALGEGAED